MKFCGNSPQKGGLVHQKGGRSEGKRGFRQMYNTEGPYRVFLWYRLGKYQENTNRYHIKIPNWDATLENWGVTARNALANNRISRDVRQALTSLSSCWLRPSCRHLILFLRYPPSDHKLQPTAAAAVSATVATADYVLRPHYNCCQEDNIVVAVVLARGILVVVVNCSPASMMMVPRPSFSWRDGN